MSKVITIRVEDDVYTKLEESAKIKEISVGKYVLRIINEWFTPSSCIRTEAPISQPVEDAHAYTESEPCVYKEEPPQPEYIPWYNRAIHKAGDKVRMVNNGRVTIQIVPEINEFGEII